MVSSIQLGIASLSSLVFIALLGMGTDFLIHKMENTLIACQHDTVSINGRCDCSDSGIFDGKFCENCLCENNGVCMITSAGSSASRWGCYCPSHLKWFGIRCELCFAQRKGKDCDGACLDNYYGAKCSTYCSANDTSLSAECLEIKAAGGVCNACNGHGTCQGDGTCKCEQDWFTNRFGESCALSCPFNCGENGQCESIGGIIQCVCKPGYFGEGCDIPCPGVEQYGRSCSGHGQCQYDGTNTTCDCGLFYRGEACELKCPGQASPCNNRGTCNSEGRCICRGGWAGPECDCLSSYTCNGKGFCNASTGVCMCQGNFEGTYCERCKPNWHGSNCQLYCDDNVDYVDGDQYGCWGRGTCQVETDDTTLAETMVCECQENLDPSTHCKECIENYYPSPFLDTSTVDSCSVECTSKTCNEAGVCNTEYNGLNFLCICDHPNLDASEDCEFCKEHWYPDDLQNKQRCSYYCDASIEEELECENKYCTVKSITYNNVIFPIQGTYCSNAGSCTEDGFCKCEDGHTGVHCENDCGAVDGKVCSGHGECKLNDLDLWYNPKTKQTRCECEPEDPYTYETRQRYAKRGFVLEPPKKKQYYGEKCQYHCPRFNEKICADRGECDTRSVSVNGRVIPCTKDEQCLKSVIGTENSFCGRDALPWDTKVPPGQFFFNAPHPGFQNCRLDSCIDSVNAIDYEAICLQNAHAIYPDELNSEECIFGLNTVEEQEQCRKVTETFFTSGFNENGTWCDEALKNTIAENINDVCSENTSNTDFVVDHYTICSRYKTKTECVLNENCIFDTSYENTQGLIQQCNGKAQTECNSNIFCEYKNNTCSYKTLCRAMNCKDTVQDLGVEQLCTAINEPFEITQTNVDWNQYCYRFVKQVDQSFTSLSPYNTFFYCWNWHDSKDPSLLTDDLRGNIDLSESTLAHRNAFLGSKTSPETCSGDQSAYCDAWLGVLPVLRYLNPLLESAVYCNDVRVYASSQFASLQHVKQVMENHFGVLCTVVDSTEDGPDDIQPFVVHTIDEVFTESSSSIYNRLKSQEDVLMVEGRLDIMRKSRPNINYLETLGVFLNRINEMSWVPSAPEIPTLCDYNICGINRCVDKTSYVECISDVSINCYSDDSLCTLGVCYQADKVARKKYRCEFQPLESIVFRFGGQNVSATRSIHGVINVPRADLEMYQNEEYTINETIKVMVDYRSEQKIVLKQEYESAIPAQVPQLSTSCQERYASKSWLDTCAVHGIYNDDFEPGTFGFDISKHHRHVFIGWLGSLYTIQKNKYSASETHDGIEFNNINSLKFNLVVNDVTVMEIYDGNRLMYVYRFVGMDLYENQEYPFRVGSVQEMFIRVQDNLIVNDDVKTFDGSEMSIKIYVTYGTFKMSSISVDGTEITPRPFVNGEWSPKDMFTWVPGVVPESYALKIKRDANDVLPVATCDVEMGTNQTCPERERESFGVRKDTRDHQSFRVFIKVDDGIKEGGNILMLDENRTSFCELYFKRLRIYVDGNRTNMRYEVNTWLELRVTLLENTLYINTNEIKSIDKTLSFVEFYNGDVSISTFLDRLMFYTSLPVNGSLRCLDTESLSNVTEQFRERVRMTGFFDAIDYDMSTVCSHVHNYISQPFFQGYFNALDSYNVVDINRYHSYPNEPCSDGKGQNWTAYCMYFKDMKVPFPENVSQSVTEQNMINKCPSVLNEMVSKQYVCRNPLNCSETPGYYESCFDRTSGYATRCTSDCTNVIQNTIDGDYCNTRTKTLNITFDAPCPSTCSTIMKTEVSITDFCSSQQMYQQYDQVKKTSFVSLVDLQSSTCSASCLKTLQQSLSIPDWVDWCKKLVDREIPGTCSTTTCDCTTAESSGSTCQLTCPMGSNGKVCSGENGFCIPEDNSQQSYDTIKQEESGEIGTPLWLKSEVDPMQGECECIFGSGEACDIPCYQCSNGTYGWGMQSQQGICDGSNGVCRGLPPFTRYNVSAISEDGNPVSYNTTSFDSNRFVYPERFLYQTFQDVQTILETQAFLLTQNKYIYPERIQTPITNIDINSVTILGSSQRLFRHLCPTFYTDKRFTYAKDQYGFDITSTYVFGQSVVQGANNMDDFTNIDDIIMVLDNSTFFAYYNDAVVPLVVDGVSPTHRKHARIVSDDSSIYMWGGVSSNGIYVSDMWQFQVTKQTFMDKLFPYGVWISVEQENVPEARQDHAMVRMERYIYMIGGYYTDFESNPIQDTRLYSFNIQTRVWSIMNVSGSVPYMYNHTMIAHQGELYISHSTSLYVITIHQDVVQFEKIQGFSAPSTMFMYSWDVERVMMFSETNDYIMINKNIQTLTRMDSTPLERIVYNHNHLYLVYKNGNWAEYDFENQQVNTDQKTPTAFDTNLCLVEYKINPIVYHTESLYYAKSSVTKFSEEKIRVFCDADESCIGYQTDETAFWAVFNTTLVSKRNDFIFWKKKFSSSIVIHGYNMSTYIFNENKHTHIKVYYDDILVNDVSVAVDFTKRFQRSFQLWQHVKPDSWAIKPDKQISLWWKRILMMQDRYDIESYMNQLSDYTNDLFKKTDMKQNPYHKNEIGLYQSIFIEMDTNPFSSASLLSSRIYRFNKSYIVNIYFDNVFDYTDEQINIRIFNNNLRIQMNVCEATSSDFTCDFTLGVINRFYVPFYILDEDITDKFKTLRIIMKENDVDVYTSTDILQEIHIDTYEQSNIAYTSGYCGTTITTECPGFVDGIGLPCTGRGRCNRACFCVCDHAPDAIAASVEASSSAITSSFQTSPYRGKGCEITCPGYDGRSMDSICSGKGTCDQNGQCICNYGYTGDNCQFQCPGYNPNAETLEESNFCSGRGSCTVTTLDLDQYSDDNIECDTEKRCEYLRDKNKLNRALFVKALDSFYNTCEREMNYSRTDDYSYKKGIMDGVCTLPRSMDNNEDGKIYAKVNITQIDDPHIVQGMKTMTDGLPLYTFSAVCESCKEQYQPFAKTIYECYEKAKSLKSKSFVFHNDDCFVYTHDQSKSYRRIIDGYIEFQGNDTNDIEQTTTITRNGQGTFEECMIKALNAETSYNFLAIPKHVDFSDQIPCYIYTSTKEIEFNNNTIQQADQFITYKIFNKARYDDLEICSSGKFKQSDIGCDICPIGTHKLEESKAFADTCAEAPYNTNISFEHNGGGKGCQQTINGLSHQCCLMFGGCLDGQGDPIPRCPIHSTCTPCPTGTYQDNQGQFFCKSCPKGYYQNEQGRSVCKSCNEGTTTNGFGSTSISQCDGKCKSQGNGNLVLINQTCQECSSGRFESSDTCANCAVGTFKRKIIKYGTTKNKTRPINPPYTTYIDMNCVNNGSIPQNRLEAFQAAFQYLYILYGRETALTLQMRTKDNKQLLKNLNKYYIHYLSDQCIYVLDEQVSDKQVCVEYSSGEIQERIDIYAVDTNLEIVTRESDDYKQQYTDYYERTSGTPDNTPLTLEQCRAAATYFNIPSHNFKTTYNTYEPYGCSMGHRRGNIPGSSREIVYRDTRPHGTYNVCGNTNAQSNYKYNCILAYKRDICVFQPPVLVPNGPPAFTTTKEDCQQYAILHGLEFHESSVGCVLTNQGSLVTYGPGTCTGNNANIVCIQYKHKKIQEPPTLYTSGYPPTYMSEQDCRDYAEFIDATFGINQDNPGPGCVTHPGYADVRYNPGTSISGDHGCSENNICVFFKKENTAPTTIADTCHICPPGTYTNTTGSSSCIPCPVGEYQDGIGSTTCKASPRGTFTTSEGATTYEECPIGTFSTGYRHINKMVDITTYSESIALSTLETCLEYAYHKDVNEVMYQAGQCILQPGSGPAQAVVYRKGSDTCTDCQDNTVNPYTKQSRCFACNNGYNTNAQKTACEPCPRGQYQPPIQSYNTVQASNQAISYTNYLIGSGSCDNNIQCNAVIGSNSYNLPYNNIVLNTNYELKVPNNNDCQNCSQGHVQPFEASTSCHACDIGQYEPKQGQTGYITNSWVSNSIFQSSDFQIGAGSIDDCLDFSYKQQYHYIQLQDDTCHLWNNLPTQTHDLKPYQILQGSLVTPNSVPKKTFVECLQNPLAQYIQFNHTHCLYSDTYTSGSNNIYQIVNVITHSPLYKARATCNTCTGNTYNTARGATMCNQVCLKRLLEPLHISMRPREISSSVRSLQDPLEWSRLSNQFVLNTHVYNISTPVQEACPLPNENHNIEFYQQQIKHKEWLLDADMTFKRDTKTQFELLNNQLKTNNQCLMFLNDDLVLAECNQPLTRGWVIDHLRLRYRGLCIVYDTNTLTRSRCAPCIKDTDTRTYHQDIFDPQIQNCDLQYQSNDPSECRQRTLERLESSHGFYTISNAFCGVYTNISKDGYCINKYTTWSYTGGQTTNHLVNDEYQLIEYQEICQDCLAGYEFKDNKCQECTAPLVSQNGTCQVCSNTSLYQDAKICKPCAPGTKYCVACEQGQYQPLQGSTTCLACPKGHYQDQTQQYFCKECIPGYYQDQTETTSCKICLSGQYQSAYASDACITSQPGHYQPVQGALGDLQCPPGHYQNEAGQSSCKRCDEGQFQPSYASTSCLTCSVGRYMNKTGHKQYHSEMVTNDGLYLDPFDPRGTVTLHTCAEYAMNTYSDSFGMFFHNTQDCGVYNAKPHNKTSGTCPQYKSKEQCQKMPNYQYDFQPFIDSGPDVFALRKNNIETYVWGYYGRHVNNNGVHTAIDPRLDMPDTFDHVKTIATTTKSYVIHHVNDSLTVFGYSSHGGYMPPRTDIQNVSKVVSCHMSFTAIFHNQTTYTWGQLNIPSKTNILDIYCTKQTFVFTQHGNVTFLYGTNSTLNKQLSNVKKVISLSNNQGLLALFYNGTLHGWGYIPVGVVPNELFLDIYATSSGFGALTERRTFLTWGYGTNDYTQVEKVWSNDHGFALLFSDKTVRAIPDQSMLYTVTNVKDVFTTKGAFAVLTYDGDVSSWGFYNCESGDSTSADSAPTCYFKPTLSNIIDIKATHGSFIALSSSGTAVGWGEIFYGVVANVDSFPATNRLYTHNVKAVQTHRFGISFVLNDGSVRTIGYYEYSVRFTNQNADQSWRGWNYYTLAFPGNAYVHPSTGCVQHQQQHYFIQTDYIIDCSESYSCRCDIEFIQPVTYSPGTNVYQAADGCAITPPGTFVNTTAATDPTPCPTGQYQPYREQTSCIPCPNGFVTTFTGQSACTMCPPGTGTTDSTQCTNCSIGTYSKQGICTSCPIGRYGDEEALDTCKECPEGQYQSLEGQTQCSECPTGTYATMTGLVTCEPTPAGYDWIDSQTIQPCPLGHEQPLTGQLDCNPCSPGHFADSLGTVECSACPLGRFQNGQGSYNCSRCNDGQYQDQTGQTSCTDCSFGTYSNASEYGSIPLSQCVLCGQHEYQDQQGQGSCKSCPQGQYQYELGKYSCTLNEQQQTNCIPSYESINGSCVRCNIGEYSDGSTCLDKSSTCPDGQGYEFNIYRDRDNCQNCTAGFYSDQDNQDTCKTKKTTCAPGQKLVATNNQKDNLCQECLKDYYNTDGITCISCQEQQGASYYTNETGQISCTRGCEYTAYQNKSGTYYVATTIAYQPPVTLSTNQFGSLETAVHATVEDAKTACGDPCDGVSEYNNGKWSAGIERSVTVSSHVSGFRKLDVREERTVEYDHWNCVESTLIGGYFDLRQECQTSAWVNQSPCQVQFTTSTDTYGDNTKYLSEADAQNACTSSSTCQGITHWHVLVADGNCASAGYVSLTQSECAGMTCAVSFNLKQCPQSGPCNTPVCDSTGTCSKVQRNDGRGWQVFSTHAWNVQCVENYEWNGLYEYKFNCFCQYWSAGPAGYTSSDTKVSTKKKQSQKDQSRTYISGKNCNTKPLTQVVTCQT
mgnify:CR=1 FL=1